MDGRDAEFPTLRFKSGRPTSRATTICKSPRRAEMDLAGNSQADAEGRYYFRSVVPAGYSIPMDGPVGELIRAQKRHGFRPSHVHYLIGAPGYKELVTALYVHGDPHIDSDTVFGVTDSLVVKVSDPDPSSPFPSLPGIRYDFTLAAAGRTKLRARGSRSVADHKKVVARTVESVH